VYVGSADKSLYAINAADGSKKWAYQTGGNVQSSPVLSPEGTVVYVGSNGKSVYAINTMAPFSPSLALTGFAPGL
jgi:outer membrane protein assembly factor BamB